MSFRKLQKFTLTKNKCAKANLYFVKAKKRENLKKKSENISNFKKFFFKFWAEQIFLKIIIQRLDFAFLNADAHIRLFHYAEKKIREQVERHLLPGSFYFTSPSGSAGCSPFRASTSLPACRWISSFLAGNHQKHDTQAT